MDVVDCLLVFLDEGSTEGMERGFDLSACGRFGGVVSVKSDESEQGGVE